MPTSTQIDLTLASLAEAIDGHLVLPSDADWDEARRAWNLAVEQLPEAVVYPAGVDDVIAVVEFARDHGLGIVVQGTGRGMQAPCLDSTASSPS